MRQQKQKINMDIPNFNDKNILSIVFTHRSYLNESKKIIESNERYEFLGDSILSFLVSSYIFKTYPELKEGELTNLRSILTNTETLAKLGGQLKLGEKLRLSKGEEAGGGRHNKTILANTFEALLGGIFLDVGLEKARQFIEGTILAKIDAIVDEHGLKDPKSTLQEILQEKYKVSPHYEIAHEEGPDHARVYTVEVYKEEEPLGKGMGKSKQEAEKMAAKDALSKL